MVFLTVCGFMDETLHFLDEVRRLSLVKLFDLSPELFKVGRHTAHVSNELVKLGLADLGHGSRNSR